LYHLQIKGTDCFFFNEGSCKQNIFDEASKRQIHNQIIKAQRGIIYDRNKNILAMSLPARTLCINPNRLFYKDNNVDLRKLSNILSIPYEKLKKIIYKNKDRKEYYLKRHVSKSVYLEVSKISDPNIYFINENKRSYLGGEAFSNVIGFTDIDDNGQEGIELVNNDVLKPEDGYKKIKKDNIGRSIETIEVTNKPSPGKDLILTLDKRIQIVAYDVLKKYVQKYRAESGSIILVESKSGNILSMTNYPSFDPEKRHTYKGLKLKNRAIHDLIEPGSTIKPFIIYAGLKNKVIDESTIIDTAPGVIKLGNKEIKDWKYLGKVSTSDIIKFSSNIGAAKVSKKLSKKQLISNLDLFGFGQSLFINLPGSKNGSLPSPNSLSESDHFSIGYGYGLSVSLMHLVNAYTILANIGSQTQLKYISNTYPDDNKQVLDVQISNTILDMMSEVVHSPDGTGKKASVSGYTVYGKTGTVRKIKNGEYNKNLHNALFIGILGDPKPKYVAAVIIREPQDREGSGGFHAAPVFGEFLQHTMRILDDIRYAGTD
jgi:cell division protein FtsI (penicillin-binding protein 3)